jgi:hypothetical protein
VGLSLTFLLTSSYRSSSEIKEINMPDIITLKALCADLKIDPREAREKLRAAASDAKANPELAKARKPRTPWQWVMGSKAELEARATLNPNN